MAAVGVTQWVLDREGPAALARAAQLGFSAIQIDAAGVADSGTRRRYAAAARDSGVVICAIATRAMEETGLSRDLVRAAIDAAAELGVPLVYVPCFNRTELRGDDERVRTAEFLHEACEYAATGDLLIASENTLGATGNRALAARVAHERFRVLVDHYNAVLWGHDPLELVEARLPHACGQLHCKDGSGGVTGLVALGEGDGLFVDTCARLRATGFAGLVVCENDYRTDGEKRAARDLAALARHLAPVSAG